MKNLFLLIAFLLIGFQTTVYSQINDDPCYAFPINADGGCESGTTVSASQDWVGDCQMPELYENSVYYRTTTSAGNTRLKATLTGLDEGAVMILDFNGNCEGTPTILAQNCGLIPLEAEAMVKGGKTYYIMVSTTEESAGTFTLCLEETAPPPGCAENDDYRDAEDFGTIIYDDPTVCLEGCNIGGTSDDSTPACFPEGWVTSYYKFRTNVNTNIANITVKSDDPGVDVIAVALATDCSGQYFDECSQGANGYVKLNAISVFPGILYYILVATPPEGTGRFDVCVQTYNITGDYCVGRDYAADTSLARLIVTNTSFGSPKNGPYVPGEEVSFEYHIPDYSATTSVQWLQGIVPIFGTGWDPASFDENGMPLISSGPESVNEAEWKWWSDGDVKYNGNSFAFSLYTDILGQLALCYFRDADCDNNGIKVGEGLPAGWYAYFHGTGVGCSPTGHPNQGWGDGREGPWVVTFTLKARPSAGPEGCIATGLIDCSVKMFTISDEQVGCWQGAVDPNACSGDGYEGTDGESKNCEVPKLSFDINRDEFTMEFINTSEDSGPYFWDFGDGHTSTEENPVHTYSFYGVYPVTLSAENDCGPFTLKYELVIYGPPYALFDVSHNTGCEPYTVDFINQSEGEKLEYLWTFEGGIPESSMEENPQVKYLQAGNYDVTLIAFNDLYSDTLVYENYITVLPLPIADFDYEISGDTVYFQGTSSHVNTYLWDFGNGSEAEGENPKIVYAEPGEYDVTLITINNCGADTIVKKIEIITGLEEIPLDAIVIFPNPFNDILNIKFSSELSGTVELNLMDISGKLLYSERFGLDNSVKRLVNLSGLNSGLYILEIKNNDRVAYRKLVK